VTLERFAVATFVKITQLVKLNSRLKSFTPEKTSCPQTGDRGYFRMAQKGVPEFLSQFFERRPGWVVDRRTV
jgi:hypothetical protein